MSELEDEIKKCREDPMYFFTHYCRVKGKDGNFIKINTEAVAAQLLQLGKITVEQYLKYTKNEL